MADEWVFDTLVTGIAEGRRPRPPGGVDMPSNGDDLLVDGLYQSFPDDRTAVSIDLDDPGRSEPAPNPSGVIAAEFDGTDLDVCGNGGAACSESASSADFAGPVAGVLSSTTSRSRTFLSPPLTDRTARWSSSR